MLQSARTSSESGSLLVRRQGTSTESGCLLVRRQATSTTESQAPVTVLRVEGVLTQDSADEMEEELRSVDGVYSANVDLRAHLTTVPKKSAERLASL